MVSWVSLKPEDLIEKEQTQTQSVNITPSGSVTNARTKKSSRVSKTQKSEIKGYFGDDSKATNSMVDESDLPQAQILIDIDDDSAFSEEHRQARDRTGHIHKPTLQLERRNLEMHINRLATYDKATIEELANYEIDSIMHVDDETFEDMTPSVTTEQSKEVEAPEHDEFVKGLVDLYMDNLSSIRTMGD